MARQMKDSGISWVGQIPEHWDVVRTKNCYTNKKQVVGEDADSYERLALTLNGVIKRPKDDSTGLQPEAFNGYQVLRKNELVFKLIDLANVATSRVGYSPYEGIVSPAYIILHPNHEDESKFGEYYFLSLWQREIFNHMGDDGVRSSLNAGDLLNIPYLLVPSDEKKKIVQNLNEQCAEIDTVIEKTKATIEEYKKLKQSVITEAVTKGIRGTRKIKKSTIDYLGDYPSEWEISSINNLFAFLGGYAFKSELFCDETANQVLRIGNIRNDELLVDNKPIYINDDYADIAKSSQIQPNDILFTMTGTRGKQDYFYTVCIKPDDVKDKNLYLNQRVGCFRSKQNLDMRYYAYLLKVAQIKDFIFLFETGTANQGNLGIETIRRTKLFVPPIEEQKEIANYIDKKCAEIDTLISKKTALLEEMESYKKSVIYEYVTGKKEVL